MVLFPAYELSVDTGHSCLVVAQINLGILIGDQFAYGNTFSFLFRFIRGLEGGESLLST